MNELTYGLIDSREPCSKEQCIGMSGGFLLCALGALVYYFAQLGNQCHIEGLSCNPGNLSCTSDNTGIDCSSATFVRAPNSSLHFQYCGNLSESFMPGVDTSVTYHVATHGFFRPSCTATVIIDSGYEKAASEYQTRLRQ